MNELEKIADGGNSQRWFKLQWISRRGVPVTLPLVVASVMIVCVCITYSTYVLLYCMLDIFIINLLKF